MSPKDVDRMANTVDPDQTAPTDCSISTVSQDSRFIDNMLYRLHLKNILPPFFKQNFEQEFSNGYDDMTCYGQS